MTAQAKLQANVPNGLFLVSTDIAEQFGMSVGTLHADMWMIGFFHYLEKYSQVRAVMQETVKFKLPEDSDLFDSIRDYCE